MIGQILTMALALGLAARFIECLCSKQKRNETVRRHILSILRNTSVIAILLYVYFLIFVIPSQGNRLSASDLSTMTSTYNMSGGGAHLRDAHAPIVANANPIVWPSQKELSENICKQVHYQHVPSVSDF